MKIKDTIQENLIQFIVGFAVAFFLLIFGALWINILWELWTTELGLSFNYDTLPIQIEYEIYAKYILIDLIVVGIISFIVGVFVASLFNSSDF